MTIALIRAALEAVTAYLNHATASMRRRDIRESEAVQRELRAKIERLRETGKEEDAQNADILFNDLQREKAAWLRMTTLVAVACLLLVGCATAPAPIIAPLPVLNIYQPSILVLPAGVPVAVEGGTYTPQTREVWHSDKRFRELERKGY